jgi:hypothetical protein
MDLLLLCSCYCGYLLMWRPVLVMIMSSILTPRSWVLFEKPAVAHQLKNTEHFMEREGSLLCSQELAAGVCSEPDKSSPYTPPPPHSIPLRPVLTLSTIYIQIFLVVSLLQVFVVIPRIHSCLPLARSLILLDLITLIVQVTKLLIV